MESPKQDSKISSKVRVLHAFRPFHHILTLYNADNFRERAQKQRIRNICHAGACSTLIFITTIDYISNAYFCYQNISNMEIVGQPISVFFVCIQVFFTCFSLWKKNMRITTFIEQLQSLIEVRE